MSDKTPLGDRMKSYELKDFLPKRSYIILRMDGRAFHSYLRKAVKPFDDDFMVTMDNVTAELCQEIGGTVFGYTQSDEISLLLQDFETPTTQPWFGGNIQKMVSSAAALTTALFAKHVGGLPFPSFDARVFTLPDATEVANYFVWRQRDAERNSVTMLAQNYFSHNVLHKINVTGRQELLKSVYGIDWCDLANRYKYGRIAKKILQRETITYRRRDNDQEINTKVNRSRWVVIAAKPFTEEWFASMIPSRMD